MNERQHTTRYIQNGGDCTKIKGCSPLQHRNGLIGLKPEIPHICIYPSVGSNKNPRVRLMLGSGELL